MVKSMLKISSVMVLLAMFYGCDSDLKQARIQISESQRAFDSLLGVWEADASWEDSLRREPTLVWQSYFRPGERYAVDRLRLIDLSRDDDGKPRVIYFSSRGYKLDLACDGNCQMNPDFYTRGYRHAVFFEIDSLVPEYLISGSIEVNQEGTTQELSSKMKVIRVIYGKLLFSKAEQ